MKLNSPRWCVCGDMLYSLVSWFLFFSSNHGYMNCIYIYIYHMVWFHSFWFSLYLYEQSWTMEDRGPFEDVSPRYDSACFHEGSMCLKFGRPHMGRAVFI